jgi:hypothetical protein
MKRRKFIELYKDLFYSITAKELKESRIRLIHLIESLRLTFEDIEKEMKAKSKLVAGVDNYARDTRAANRENLLMQIQEFQELIAEE